MRREFTLTHVVRGYDECNCFGLLTPAAFLRLLQDISAHDILLDTKLEYDGSLVIRRSIVNFKAPVKKFTRLELKTFGTGFGRVSSQRGYEVRLTGQPSAEPIISARTTFVYLGLHGRPQRVPEKMVEIWRPDVPEPSQAEMPMPAFPESEPATFTFHVGFSDIDLEMHMNNAAIVEKLDNAAWDVYAAEGVTLATARMDALTYDIEYMASPRLGDRLEIHTWFSPAPAPGQEFGRFQQITRAGKVMARAHSRWLWKAEKRSGVEILNREEIDTRSNDPREAQRDESKQVLVAVR